MRLGNGAPALDTVTLQGIAVPVTTVKLLQNATESEISPQSDGYRLSGID